MAMANHLFLIAGGGTGAKVAESFIHLCAAGLGPAEVHVLFVDSDSSNGNLKRALATGRAYAQMQRWPWSVQTNEGGVFGVGARRQERFRLFTTDIRLHEITQPLETALNGGIKNAIRGNGMEEVLDLLYDEDEQAATCDDGFRARPNLGCLLLAGHLTERLPREGAAFLDALDLATKGGNAVPVVVAASVFGGMGASLIPVVRGCVEEALRARREGQTDLTALRWGAVKMLPHYQPDKRLESVDPDRYLLDSASALQYYSAVQRTAGDGGYGASYVVGSDRPERNRVKTVLGFTDQANPAYFEEFIGALAVEDYAGRLGQGRGPIRRYDPGQGTTLLRWENLPHARRDDLKTRFAYLLHTAAFYLRQGGQGDRTNGLAALFRQSSDAHLYEYPWYKKVLDPWAEQHPAYRGTPKAERAAKLKQGLGEQSLAAMQTEATDYFARLLLWADTALRDDPRSTDKTLDLLDYANDDYASLYDSMARLDARAIDAAWNDGTAVQYAQDNALVRLARTALSAMVTEHEVGSPGTELEFAL